MPNIGFFELLLISVVALLVLGPEKLPGAIRTTSLWVGRARRSFNKAKAEIEQQLNTDEIRRQLHNESIMADLENARKEVKSLADNTSKELKKFEQGVDATAKEIRSSPNDATADMTALDPASLDEEQLETEESATASAREPAVAPAMDNKEGNKKEDNKESAELDPSPTAPPKRPPVQDFYNNPGVGILELQGGAIKPAPGHDKPADAPEQAVKK